MVTLIDKKTILLNGKDLLFADEIKGKRPDISADVLEKGYENTMAYSILKAHNTAPDMENLRLKFDALTSHDITYVGITQTARASGLKEFPLPYVLTNCHNSLCAVGGTINEDDHLFGLSAAKKYGGIYVPANLAVIHQYMREAMTRCGAAILGSDSHTRYGALGTLSIGEGGPELVRQLLGRTYDVARPPVVAVYLEGEPVQGVGPQDVALALIGSVFKDGFVKNCVLEFVGPGVAGLSMDFRNGIDVMTTETTCLSSIWITDEKTKEFYRNHKRAEDFKVLNPDPIALYDKAVRIDLGKVKPMIALPFHPSNVYSIDEVNENPADILEEVRSESIKYFGEEGAISFKNTITPNGVSVDQGIIAGCSGGNYENICAAAQILKGSSLGAEGFTLSVYPQSQPVFFELNRHGVTNDLFQSGVLVKPAFCGPCFGAGDTPGQNALSIRHTTRNFPSREGSKPGEGQVAGVALMDARSIAATAKNRGILTPATDVEYTEAPFPYRYEESIYVSRVYNGFNSPRPEEELLLGPGIRDWPETHKLKENLALVVVAYIDDPVTTTDELIPSGETSSFRSNPERLAGFALSRRVPEYVSRAREIREVERQHLSGEITDYRGVDLAETSLGSVIYANSPGDGSAREQAASCQKVLGGWANIATSYATKRYQSNLINWGLIPFLVDEQPSFAPGDMIVLRGVRKALTDGADFFKAMIIREGSEEELSLRLPSLTGEQREILLAGSLINFYRSEKSS